MNLLKTVENDMDNSLSAEEDKVKWIGQRHLWQMRVGKNGRLSASLSWLLGLAKLKINLRILIGGDHNLLNR